MSTELIGILDDGPTSLVSKPNFPFDLDGSGDFFRDAHLRWKGIDCMIIADSRSLSMVVVFSLGDSICAGVSSWSPEIGKAGKDGRREGSDKVVPRPAVVITHRGGRCQKRSKCGNTNSDIIDFARTYYSTPFPLLK